MNDDTTGTMGKAFCFTRDGNHRLAPYTSSASLTFRGPVASDGLFTTCPCTHIVVDPRHRG